MLCFPQTMGYKGLIWKVIYYFRVTLRPSPGSRSIQQQNDFETQFIKKYDQKNIAFLQIDV